MFGQLSRVSCRQASTFVARSARTGSVVQMRGFIAPTVSRRADFVQELYLKELKAYKIPPVKDSDAAGQVQTFSIPKAPKSPEEADLASSLKEYESLAVDVEGSESSTTPQGATGSVVADWLEVDEDPKTAHH